MLPAGLSVIHDSVGCCQDKEAKVTRGKQIRAPLLQFSNTNIEARRDDSALVDAAIELNNNLSTALVINKLELVDVAVGLHDLQEFDGDLGDRADQNLLPAELLSIGNILKGIGERVNAYHDQKIRLGLRRGRKNDKEQAQLN